MKIYVGVILLLSSLPSYGQADVYLCDNPNMPGGKEYRNTGETRGCKRMDLPTPEMLLKKRFPGNFSKAIIGMTPQDAKAKVGKPLQIKKTKTRNGNTESWLYAGGKKLTFINGVLEVSKNSQFTSIEYSINSQIIACGRHSR